MVLAAGLHFINDQSGDFPASEERKYTLESFPSLRVKYGWQTDRLLTGSAYWGCKMRTSKQKCHCYLTWEKLGPKPKMVQISSDLSCCLSVRLFNGIDMFPWKMWLHWISVFWEEHCFVSGPFRYFLPQLDPDLLHSIEMNVAQETYTHSVFCSITESLA